MTDLRKAAQQALEALKSCSGVPHWPALQPTIGALHAALAQQDEPVEPVREPVAWIHTDLDKPRVKFLEWSEDEPGYRGRWIKTPLYLAPPQRQPQTLDEALQQPRALAQAYENGYKAGEAHERERCLRLIDDHVRAVDSEDVVRAIKEVQGCSCQNCRHPVAP